MKILYVTSMPLEYNSSATLRNLALIRGLKSLGHQVDALTTQPSPKFINYDKDIYGKLHINRYYIPLPAIYSMCTSKRKTNGFMKVAGEIKKVVRRFYYDFSLYDPMKTAVGNIEKVALPAGSYDLLISSSDPLSSHLLAKRLIGNNPQKFAKWVQYWGDPLFLNIEGKSKLPGFIIKRVEKGLLALGNRVVYVSPLTAEAQKKLYPAEAEKMFFVPGAYLEVRNLPRREKGSLQLGYFGDYYYMNRNIMPLCKAIEESEAKLLVAGNGDAAISKIKGVTVYPRASYPKIKYFEEHSDVLVCICNKRGTQIPGKLYHYAGTNKPILVLLDQESFALQKYLSSFQRYLLCKNEPEAIKRFLDKLLSGQLKRSWEPSPHFHPVNIARRFLEVAQ